MTARVDPDQLRALLETAWAAAAVPGAVAGVVVDGELAWWSGVGRAHLDRPEPPDADSLARVASITKPFTATAILQLRDEGRLSLDDPLERHVPELAGLAERGGRRADVTIRRVLTHRSGLVTESPLVRWSDPWFPDRDALLAAIPDTAVVLPGDAAMKYSNLGFGLLGEVMARVSGRPYGRYLHEEILAPLGMGASALEPDARGLARRMTGYTPMESEDRPAVAPVVALAGQEACGQLQSNVRDLARWLAFQCREDGGPRGGAQVLDGRTLAEMHRPLFLEPDWSAGHALAWRMVRVGERAYFTHGGGIHGFASSVAFHVPGRVGAIVLANAWPSTMPAHLSLRLLEALLGDQGRPVLPPPPSGIAPRRPTDPPPTAAPDALRPFLGRYRAEPAVLVRVAWHAGELRLLPDAPDAFPLHAPANLDPADGAALTFRVRQGRGAGETLTLTPAPAAGPASFTLGGFDFRRLG
ncbi:MAG: serine hydrolase domain-containing protein [Chloroflexota bacterium]